jgi:hypothetical protein
MPCFSASLKMRKTRHFSCSIVNHIHSATPTQNACRRQWKYTTVNASEIVVHLFENTWATILNFFCIHFENIPQIYFINHFAVNVDVAKQTLKSKIMKKYIMVFLLALLSLTKAYAVKECDIASVYSAIAPERGTKVFASYGTLQDVETILVPTTLDAGRYAISITRKGSNIYQVDDTKLYIETKWCYEYATRDDALLIMESSYYSTRGKIVFL